ncbi:hypothetical protein ScPMuIL_002621 [Solemya velum]
MASTDMIRNEFWRNGPQPGSFYNFPGGKNSEQIGSAKRTLQPIVTGTSVLGVKFDQGVIIAADMLGSYGSLARYRDFSRVSKVNNSTVIGCGGDIADFQFLKSIIEQRVIDEECLEDGFSYTPSSLFSWVTRVLYNRRSKFDPLWNTYIIGGVDEEKTFLGYVDKIGMSYQADSVASGYGAYMAQPMDARSLNKYEVAIVTKDGVEIKSPLTSETSWDIANFVSGYE